ncbi:hypothetical protein ABPG74_009456 [Tetrahymena malaccensis]
MVFGLITHFIEVITNEIVEDVQIIKEVLAYHISELGEYRYQQKEMRKIKQKMNYCDSYEEWVSYSIQHDSLKDITLWKKDPTSPSYNFEYIQHLRDQLKQDRLNKNVLKIIHTLRSHAFRNIGNILDPLLYKECFNGTKDLIEDFQNEIDLCIQYIASTSQLSVRKKMEFFIEMKHAVGRTALVLSGGGLMGMYHVGVVKTLYEQKLLPRIISGSSAGSIIAAFICTRKYEELPSLFLKDGINWQAFTKRDPKGQMIRKLKRFFKEGVLLDVKVLYEFTRQNIGDITFQEAYDRTGFILNITVTGQGTHDNDRVLNYLSAPNVIIWSAVCCSCGIPYIYGPSDLLCKNEKDEIVLYLDKKKKFVDGSIGADLPMHRLSEFFNVNSFIVSQTNPWVVPFMDRGEKHPIVYLPFVKLFNIVRKLLNSELKHRVQQLSDFDLLPGALSKWVNIVLQTYVGHITIAPVPRWSDYANVLEVPKSSDDFEHFMLGGARKTFSKIPYIKAYMRYENSLTRGYNKIKQQLAEDSGPIIPVQDPDESYDNESIFMDAFEEEEDFRDKRISIGKSKSIYEDSKRVRNYSFIIPRTKSKEVLEKLNKIGVKPALVRKNSSSSKE